MNFKRGQDIKVALDIGARKEAIKLENDPALDITYVTQSRTVLGVRSKYPKRIEHQFQKRIEHHNNIRGTLELLSGKETTATHAKITGRPQIESIRTIKFKEFIFFKGLKTGISHGLTTTIDLGNTQDQEIIILWRDVLYLIKGRVVSEKNF